MRGPKGPGRNSEEREHRQDSQREPARRGPKREDGQESRRRERRCGCQRGEDDGACPPRERQCHGADRRARHSEGEASENPIADELWPSREKNRHSASGEHQSE
ncbi:hypothetical protein [Arthrobacter sp. MMS18-M83]|uniref:hypothetical protein n=1 Tax=Arthrobacter sp. MMS18-M83 TaxID=2996261 RepID=UPI00227A8FEB|nr:hypothetical protein [Arthrobacter sp. MMS18-M83]WAH96813.1 hypothetical protein OW521_20985 [Arthrobacter sp. MMS18-M83]